MPIFLVTGANGHGKGQWAIREILRLQDENDKREKQGKPRRPIYTNIHGINEKPQKPLKDCQKIPSDKVFFGKQDNPNAPPPEGYFVPPVGSIFMYDEAQKIDWIKHDGKKLSTDERVKSLEEHRHAGLDIYFLTQSPHYIHSHIYGLVSPHIYLERPQGQPFTNVFVFNKPQSRPENATKRADDQYIMQLSKKYGQYYLSSAEHNMKARFPLKIKLLIGVFIAIIAFTAYRWTNTRYYKQSDETAKTPATAVATTTPASSPAPIQTQVQLEQQLLEQKNQLLIKQAEIDMYKNRLNVTYQIEAKNADLRVGGVMVVNGKCSVYNSYGDLMTMSEKECKHYIAKSGRILKSRQAQQSIQPMSIPQTTNAIDTNPVQTTIDKVS